MAKLAVKHVRGSSACLSPAELLPGLAPGQCASSERGPRRGDERRCAKPSQGGLQSSDGPELHQAWACPRSSARLHRPERLRPRVSGKKEMDLIVPGPEWGADDRLGCAETGQGPGRGVLVVSQLMMLSMPRQRVAIHGCKNSTLPAIHLGHGPFHTVAVTSRIPRDMRRRNRRIEL